MGLRRVRGVRSTLPTNTIIGRRSGGSGKAEMLDLADVARDLETYGAGSSAPVVGLPTGGLAGQVLAIVAGVATWTYTTAITAVGIITSGTWRGTKVELAYGGTNADLSATGGASQVLKQTSVGGAVTVAQLAASDLSNGVTGSGAVVLAASPALSGHPTGVTESPGDNTTRLASTAFVTSAIAAAPDVDTFAALTDVTLAALADNDLVRYQTSDSKWHNVAKNTYSALITVLGTIATGVWQGTKIALAYGGTNADLSGTGGSGQVLKQDSVGGNVTVGLITILGTIATGVWQGTKIALGFGGTNADLSATGGASQVLMQESAGAAVTVRQLAYTDISGTVPSSASPDWDDPFLGAWSGGGWGTGPWGGLYSGIIPPSTDGQFWRSRGDAMTPEWATLATADLSDAANSTWTPAMTINGSATGITFSAQSGQYQRIGKLVFAQFDLTLSSKGVSVGSVVLTGLPLTASSQTGNCTISFTGSVTGTISWMNFVSGSTTTVALGKSGAGGWTSLVDTDITNTSRLVGQAVYLLP